MSRWNKPPDQPYSTRRADADVINVTIDKEAHALLRQYAPGSGRRYIGALIERLVYEHHARQEERARLMQELGTLQE
jgi:hypothetical protein